MRWRQDRLSNMTSSTSGSSNVVADSSSYRPSSSALSTHHRDDHIIGHIADELVNYVWDASILSDDHPVAGARKSGDVVSGADGSDGASGMRSDPLVLGIALAHQQQRAEVSGGYHLC